MRYYECPRCGSRMKWFDGSRTIRCPECNDGTRTGPGVQTYDGKFDPVDWYRPAHVRSRTEWRRV